MTIGDITRMLGRPLRHWIDIDQQLKRRGYDRFLDGYYEEQAKLHLRIYALEIEWRGLQAMADDQRKAIIELSEAIDLTGEATPWD